MSKMPVIFVGHGSPTNVAERNRFTDGWAAMAALVPKPDAVLCVSAHWFGRGLAVSGAARPDTIHDFYGFPPELYQVNYPAPGAPQLAARVASLSPEIEIDPNRGLDHGAWSVLHFMYPEAAIPVCQLSVNASFTPAEARRTGQLLKPLREEGVLIVGSGDVVHNLALVDWELPGGYDWADEFDGYIRDAVTAGRYEDAVNYQKAGPAARRAFTHRDHYDPLLYVLGAADPGENVRVFNDERVLGALSMTSFLIG